MSTPLFGSLETPFRGLPTLLRSKRSAVVKIGVAAFVLCFGFGLLMALGNLRYQTSLVSDPAEQKAMFSLLVGAFFLGAAFIPPMLGGYITMGASAAGGDARCRREELMTLPIGRLALPAMILISSAAAFLAFGLAVLLASGLSQGFDGLGASFSHPESLETMRWAPLAILGTFSFSYCVIALGNNNALACLGWILLPACLGTAIETLGYAQGSAFLPLFFAWGVPLLLYYLLLPFALYALPPRHWADHTWASSGLELTLQLVSYVTLAALCFLGWVWALVGLALGGLCAWRIVRKRPAVERRPLSGVRVAHLLGWVAILPPLVVSLGADARLMSIQPTQDGAQVVQSVLSPDERHLAIQYQPRLPGSVFVANKIKRVAIIDLTGERAPVLHPSRFAAIGGWSQDGRYLAVQDTQVGRCDAEGWIFNGRRVSLWGALRDNVLQGLLTTDIVDAQEGRVTRSLPQRRVAGGWQAPEELVRVRRTFSGQVALEDGRRRSLTLSTAEYRRLGGLNYREGAPLLLKLKPGEPQIGAFIQGHGHPSLERTRWTDEGLVTVEPDPSGWRVETLRDEGKPKTPGKQRARYRLTRGETSLLLEDVQTLYFSSLRDDAVLACAEEGVVWISLPDGERTLLLASDGPKLLSCRQLGQTRWIIRRGVEAYLLDAATWKLRDLGSHDVTRIPLAVTPHGVLFRGRALLLGQADGTLRPVLK